MSDTPQYPAEITDVVPILGGVVIDAMPMFGGGRVRVLFPNGYGASIIRHLGSYGGPEGFFEVGVLGQDGHLTYDTPITDNVIGWLSPAEVADVLRRIAAL